MVFNSLAFLLSFPLVLGVYYALPQRGRWVHLLAFSILFYMWLIPSYILVAATIILFSYGLTLWLARLDGAPRRLALWITLALTLAPLFLFKYFNFFNANVAVLAEALGWNYPLSLLRLALPLGISFQTFQALSYTIEVYHRRTDPERHLGIYALYILFFPQLVAGPIERPQDLIPQFRQPHFFDPDRFTWGLRWILWGMFKKVVVADRLAGLVDEIYRSPETFPTMYLLPATLAFAFQIYCDFSGYSDIARGVGATFGIRLMKNFDQPYLARNPADFWRRWHVSLSTWFRDYVYVPLGGSRVSRAFHYRNLILVFVVSGLWHGANWTFVLWGLFHGLAIVGYLVWTRTSPQNVRDALAPLQIPLTFALMTVGWVFFRANNVGDAWYVLTHLFDFSTPGVQPIWGRMTMLVGFGGVLILCMGDWLIENARVNVLGLVPLPLRWAGYWAMTLAVMNLGVVENVPFIYFQF